MCIIWFSSQHIFLLLSRGKVAWKKFYCFILSHASGSCYLGAPLLFWGSNVLGFYDFSLLVTSAVDPAHLT